MTTITVELDDDLAADLEAEARGRGTTPAKFLAEFAERFAAPPPRATCPSRRRR